MKIVAILALIFIALRIGIWLLDRAAANLEADERMYETERNEKLRRTQ